MSTTPGAGGLSRPAALPPSAGRGRAGAATPVGPRVREVLAEPAEVARGAPPELAPAATVVAVARRLGEARRDPETRREQGAMAEHRAHRESCVERTCAPVRAHAAWATGFRSARTSPRTAHRIRRSSSAMVPRIATASSVAQSAPKLSAKSPVRGLGSVTTTATARVRSATGKGPAASSSAVDDPR